MSVEVPEQLEEVDADAGRFRRAVALVVVVLTVCAAVVAFAQTVEGNREERAAREAERTVVAALGATLDATSRYTRASAVFDLAALLERQRANAVVRANRGDDGAVLAALEAERLDAARGAVAELSPLVADDGESLEEEDARFATYDAELRTAADRAALEQERQSELADAHGSKADTYVAVLTTLAVALFLLGLSLTVSGRSRYVLAGPGVLVAVVCLLWAALTAVAPVPRTPDAALDALVEGRRLSTVGDHEGAVAAYDRAVELRPDLATAYARRADAQFLLGSPQDTDGFVSLTDEEQLAETVADAERALELGSEDLDVLGLLGFALFLDGRPDEAVERTREALERNDRLPELWFTLGVAHVAGGDGEDAFRAYERGLALVAEEPDEDVRDQLLASARTDLSIARDLAPEHADLARSVDVALTDAETGLRLPDATADRPAEIGSVDLFADGYAIGATFDVEGVPGQRALAFVYYFRPDDRQPHVNPPGMNQFTTVGEADLDGSGEGYVSALNGDCLPAGEYRVEVFSGGTRLEELALTVEPYALGGLVSDVDEVVDVNYCRPTDWLVEPDDAGSLLISADDGSASLELAMRPSVPGVASPSAPQAALELARTLGEPTGPAVDDVVGNLVGSSVDVRTPDGRATVTVEVAEDGTVRSLVARADDAALLEVVRRELAQQAAFYS